MAPSEYDFVNLQIGDDEIVIPFGGESNKVMQFVKMEMVKPAFEKARGKAMNLETIAMVHKITRAVAQEKLPGSPIQGLFFRWDDERDRTVDAAGIVIKSEASGEYVAARNLDSGEELRFWNWRDLENEPSLKFECSECGAEKELNDVGPMFALSVAFCDECQCKTTHDRILGDFL